MPDAWGILRFGVEHNYIASRNALIARGDGRIFAPGGEFVVHPPFGAAGHSVTEITAALPAEGLPVSAQTTWQILDAEGVPRLPRVMMGVAAPARMEAVKAARLPGWPAPVRHCRAITPGCRCPRHGGPGTTGAGPLSRLPWTRTLSSWQLVGTLLLAMCACRARIHHIGSTS